MATSTVNPERLIAFPEVDREVMSEGSLSSRIVLGWITVFCAGFGVFLWVLIWGLWLVLSLGGSYYSREHAFDNWTFHVGSILILTLLAGWTNSVRAWAHRDLTYYYEEVLQGEVVETSYRDAEGNSRLRVTIEGYNRMRDIRRYTHSIKTMEEWQKIKKGDLLDFRK